MPENTSMEIFENDDYKAIVTGLVSEMPKKGRGQWTKMAQHLGLHNVVLSQIYRGDKQLTVEQAWDTAEYLGFSELESEYFLLLVQKSRAGNFRLEQYFEEKIKEVRTKSLDLKKRLKQDKELTEETRAIFYSNWYYSGIRLGTDSPEINTVEELSRRLDLPLNLVKRVVDFLLQNNLCVKENNKLSMGPARIHIGADSPLVTRHHMNWRLKAIEKMSSVDHRNEMFFTGPYSLSKSLLPKIRKHLVQVIDQCTSDVVESESETLACLNIDWFEI